MNSIDSRLKRLEGQGQRCPECGLTPNERRPMAVIYEERPEKSFEGDPYEACSGCGGPLHCVINVVYDRPAGEEEGGGASY